MATLAYDYEQVKLNAALKAKEEAQECPHCFTPVHPSNHERHMQVYHPDIDYLNASEVVMLHDREKRIESGLKIYYDVGNALLDIRDRRLYREHYASFEEYCQQRWQMSKTHANRLISASVVVENLTPIGVIPANEAQARELAPLSPDDQKIIALTVKAIAKELEVPVTAPLIKAAAKTYSTGMVTGAFEDGIGGQVKPNDAIVSQVATELAENIKRQKTYIHENIRQKEQRAAEKLAAYTPPAESEPTAPTASPFTASVEWRDGSYHAVIVMSGYKTETAAMKAIKEVQSMLTKEQAS